MFTKKIKVLIVDDSVSIQKVLSEIIASDPELEVIGTASNAFEAKAMVNDLSPDVITLDVEMPKVNGLRFLEVLMKAKPTPVLMISTLTIENAETTLQALELGAVDYITKPLLNEEKIFQRYRKHVTEKIKAVALCNVNIGLDRNKRDKHSPPSQPNSKARRVLAIGASTGGTEAINYLLSQLPAENFAVVIVQHMPAGYTTTYANRLNRTTDFSVVEAKGGEEIRPGVAYLAPGDFHLKVLRKGNHLYTDIFKGERVSGHRPSVDVLFRSVAHEIGGSSFAVLLTGMGKDGAEGLKQIKDEGGFTVAQDESSCVVYGMPKEAIKLGGACVVSPLSSISDMFIEKLH